MIDDLQREIDRLAGELGVPGAAVGIVDGDAEHALSTGIASVRTGTPVTPDTLFQIGSTSKTVTATAAMRLVEDGALSLDTRVQEVLPGFRLGDPGALDALRVRHLLTHSGGFLGDIDDTEDWGPGALSRSVHEDYAALPQLFAPGTVASYSNSGIRLLGAIVAEVSDRVFEDAVQETVLDPLGMTESVYFPWDALLRPFAVGHVLTDDGPVVARSFGIYRESAPEGGIVSSVRDQLRYLRFQLRGEAEGRPPVSDATRALMQQPHIQAGPPLDGIGLPWLLRTHGGTRIVEHGGNIGNVQLSTFALAPDLDLGVTVLTNSAPGKELGTRVLNWCLEHLRGIVPATPAEVAPAADPDAVLGRYDLNHWQHIVTRQGDELLIETELRPDLVAQGFPGMPPLRARLGEDRVLRLADGKSVGRFLVTETGAEFLHIGLRAAARI